MLESFTKNVIPDALVRPQKKGVWNSSIDRDPTLSMVLDLIDLNEASGGYDFLLQVTNPVCAEVAFSSLKLNWISSRIDGQAIAALRASGRSPVSAALQTVIAPQAPASSAGTDIVILFSQKDILFDSQTACRIRANARILLGKLVRVPSEPPLVQDSLLGETVQRLGTEVLRRREQVAGDFFQSAIGDDLQQSAVGRMAPTAQNSAPPVMRVASGTQANWMGDNNFFLPTEAEALLPKRIDLGNRQWLDVAAWLGGAVLEIGAPFGADGDQASATIRVSADISASDATYSDFSQDAELLLSASDPVGLVALTTSRIRERGQVALVNEISLVGGPASARVNNLSQLKPAAFPCGQSACPLSIGASIVAWHVGAPTAVRFVGNSGYGVLWSEEAFEMLMRYCWENRYFPRTVTQAVPIKVMVNGSEQQATGISDIKLDTLNDVFLKYDANSRTDALHMFGSAQVVPQRVDLADGTKVVPAGPNDPIFAPGPSRPWYVTATLTEQSPTGASADIIEFQRKVTYGTTSRLGRPFTEGGGTVFYSRISGFSKRILVLAE
ncbi:hypothetical protein [Microvirga sp. G4-2]|uniref:hypothetical protein n=1 Tax=Microvirga sp. G4-2 TaxID=3434467 RepID=UPI004044784B